MILDAKNIQKSFGKVSLLRGLNLSLNKGESVAIMGASGEGKTTFLHILGTLESCDTGNLSILGKDVRKSSFQSFRKNHIGFIFQSYNLLEDFTALQNILMPAQIARKKTEKQSAIYQQALFLLEMIGLKQRADYPAKVLSGGERQRVAIARALINDPDLILADEPTGNLDHTHSTYVHNLLIKCAEEFEKAIIVVTHDEELANLCSKKYLLRDGLMNQI